MIKREIDKSALSKAKPISDVLQRPKCASERPIHSRLHFIHAPLLTIIIHSAEPWTKPTILARNKNDIVVVQELHIVFIFSNMT